MAKLNWCNPSRLLYWYIQNSQITICISFFLLVICDQLRYFLIICGLFYIYSALLWGFFLWDACSVTSFYLNTFWIGILNRNHSIMQIIIELAVSHGEKLFVLFRVVVKSLIAVVWFTLVFKKYSYIKLAWKPLTVRHYVIMFEILFSSFMWSAECLQTSCMWAGLIFLWFRVSLSLLARKKWIASTCDEV